MVDSGHSTQQVAQPNPFPPDDRREPLPLPIRSDESAERTLPVLLNPL
jgi:hypothetical protein